MTLDRGGSDRVLMASLDTFESVVEKKKERGGGDTGADTGAAPQQQQQQNGAPPAGHDGLWDTKAKHAMTLDRKGSDRILMASLDTFERVAEKGAAERGAAPPPQEENAAPTTNHEGLWDSKAKHAMTLDRKGADRSS
jgi:hypothetical protein